MNSSNYPIFLVYSEEDNAWLARVDLLPGCIADGATAEEALGNAKTAIELWIETSKELNRSVPPALSLEKIEELQTHVMQKQQEFIEAAIQQATSDAIRQFQQVPKHQVLGGIVHSYATSRGVSGGLPQSFQAMGKM